MQKPITKLERNNSNTNYKTEHTKHRKIINKELDLLLNFIIILINVDLMKWATGVKFVWEF